MERIYRKNKMIAILILVIFATIFISGCTSETTTTTQTTITTTTSTLPEENDGLDQALQELDQVEFG